MAHQRIGRCVHFTGLPFRDDERGKKCAAGVDYRAHVGGSYDGWMARVPCLPNSTLSRDVVPCPLYRDPTQAEIDADEAEHQAFMAKFRKVMTAVRPWRTWTKQNRVAKQGVIECPACGGKLRLSQAAYNGHVHGKCETAGCVSWME